MSDGDRDDAISVAERSQEQGAHEAALAEVEGTIVNIQAAIRRAERAEATLREDDVHAKLAEAVSIARQELVAVRRRLQQRSYLATEDPAGYGDQVEMFDIPEEGDDDQPPLP